MNKEQNFSSKIKSLSHSLSKDSHQKVISLKKIEYLSKLLKTSPVILETKAIEAGIMPERYIRNMHTLSLLDQLTLSNIKVCVVGLGGLGGLVLENLARIGVKNFRVIDGDIFEDHNLNRQYLSSIPRLGKLKTKTAKKHLKKINPSISIITFSEYLTEENANHLIDACDIVVDCLDNIKTRFVLESESKLKKIPLVSAAIAGTTGHITTIFPEDIGLEAIFGKQENLTNDQGAETTLGCLSHTVGVVASLQSNEVVKIALGKKNLQQKLLVIDTEDYTFEVLNMS